MRSAGRPAPRHAARGRVPRLAQSLLPLLVAAAFLAAPSGTSAEPQVDHYVLALSWSPTYCEGRSVREAPLQCALDADRTFIVHGLWPNTQDDAPANCRTSEGGPSASVVDKMLDVMPSKGLVHHQWRKHGTCSGLSAADYFATVREAAAAVAVPPGLATIAETISVRPQILREAFMRANPDLPAEGIYISCRGEDLVDVRICMTPDLGFRPCPNVARRRCRSRILEVDPPR